MKNIIPLLLIFISCNHLEEGKVIYKKYEPSRTTIVYQPTLIGKTTVLIPYYFHDDEDWVLFVEGDHNGEIIEEKVYVTKDCYKKLELGDYWVKTEYCSYSDNNNTKERKKN